MKIGNRFLFVTGPHPWKRNEAAAGGNRNWTGREARRRLREMAGRDRPGSVPGWPAAPGGSGIHGKAIRGRQAPDRRFRWPEFCTGRLRRSYNRRRCAISGEHRVGPDGWTRPLHLRRRKAVPLPVDHPPVVALIHTSPTLEPVTPRGAGGAVLPADQGVVGAGRPDARVGGGKKTPGQRAPAMRVQRNQSFCFIMRRVRA